MIGCGLSAQDEYHLRTNVARWILSTANGRVTKGMTMSTFRLGLILALAVGSATAAHGQNAADRTLPYPVTYSTGYERAIERGTRTLTGAPGPAYWQQWTDYRLDARIIPDEKRLEGQAVVLYHNNSPDTLPVLFVQLSQNLHAEGAPRLIFEEITGGIDVSRVVADGQALAAGGREGARYTILGTQMAIVLPAPLAADDSVQLEFDWSFTIPQAGASSRMGWDADNLFYIAYWYPQMAVYDDVTGWHSDPFLGRAEFYMGYASYELTVTVPEGWLVTATGSLQNPDEVLSPEVAERLRRTERSDNVVRVLTSEDFGRATRAGAEGRLTWRFVADSVRDVAFAASRESLWDAARTPVGDRDGDGRTDYARVDAIYRELAPRWTRSVTYSQQAISFFSQYTGFPYPWPHMTAVEGADIIGGGMEFPMMTLIGSYNERGDTALYQVTAHEEGHMWFPMMVGSDERRRAWMDEGTTSFIENQASEDFFPGTDYEIFDQIRYLRTALSGDEGAIMRWSDYHYSAPAYRTASYSKPATMLHALRGVLGEETFRQGLRSYIADWAFRHPYPWDLFHSFESAARRDLDWFWRTWYYETWTLDHALESVRPTAEGTEIVVADRGMAPMPVHLLVTRADGSRLELQVPVDTWLAGARHAVVTVPVGSPVIQVEIDPEYRFPDADRSNNRWQP